MCGRDRQTQAAVFRIVHPSLLVLQIGQRRGDDSPGAGFSIFWLRCSQCRLTRCQLGNHKRDLSLPDPLDPPRVNLPADCGRLSCGRRGINTTEHMDEIQDRDESKGFEVPFPLRHQPVLAVADPGFSWGGEQAQFPGSCRQLLTKLPTIANCGGDIPIENSRWFIPVRTNFCFWNQGRICDGWIRIVGGGFTLAGPSCGGQLSDLVGQFVDPLAIQIDARNFRTRILRAFLAVQYLDDPRLVFMPMRIGITAFVSGLESPSIRQHGHHLRHLHTLRCLIPLCQRETTPGGHPGLSFGHTFRTDPLRNSLHTLQADRHMNQGANRLVGIPKRTELGAQIRDCFQECR